MSPDLREVETVVDSGRCLRYSINLHRGLLASPPLVSDHSIMGFILCSWNHHSFWFQQTNLIQAHWILILVTRDLFLFVQDYDQIADSNSIPTTFLGGQVLYSISGFLTMQKLSKPCRGFVKTSLTYVWWIAPLATGNQLKLPSSASGCIVNGSSWGKHLLTSRLVWGPSYRIP